MPLNSYILKTFFAVISRFARKVSESSNFNSHRCQIPKCFICWNSPLMIIVGFVHLQKKVKERVDSKMYDL